MAEEASASTSTPGASESITVPKAVFIEDVAAFMKGKTAEAVLQELKSDFDQFRLAEARQQRRKVHLLSKQPEIQKALDAVEALVARGDSDEPLVTEFQLSENVYAKAQVAAGVESVSLWLGAGVMVEYPLQEARALLAANLQSCKANIQTVESNLDFLKDSTTITEVCIARVYNFDVEERRQRAAASAGKDGEAIEA